MTPLILLVMLVLDATTGTPLEQTQLDTFTTLEDCSRVQIAQGIQKPHDGKIVVFSCITETKST